MSRVVIESASRLYGNGDGLHPTSLVVESGEFLVLLGPSGSGKTTLLRMISGFEKPDSGRISIGNVDVTNADPERRPTAMVFQSHALWPHMTVFDNVAYGLRVRKVPRATLEARVSETLKLVQLEALAHRKPGQLSGGQQQRVALGRALAVEPQVLLLDEPLSALDARLRDDLRIELRRLQERLGVTAVYVTHDQDDALAMADKVAVLDRGRILQLGTPEELYEKPANAFVARFCGDSLLLPTTVDAVGPDGALRCHIGTKHFRVRGGDPEANFLSIRPQALSVATEPASNTLAVSVERRRYAGGEYLVDLVTESGIPIAIISGDDRLQPGYRCYLQVPEERLWAVRGDALADREPTALEATAASSAEVAR